MRRVTRTMDTRSCASPRLRRGRRTQKQIGGTGLIDANRICTSSLLLLSLHGTLTRKNLRVLKGTSIEAYNCGGRFFRATGKTVEDRFDKMEKFLDECEGDGTCHPNYGY